MKIIKRFAFSMIGILLYISCVVFSILNPEYFWQPSGPHYTDPSKADLKKIVFWNSWFYDNNWKMVMGDKSELVIDCGVKCVLSTDKQQPLRYDAVVFHGKNAHIPPTERTPNQIYILLLHESPLHFWNRFMPGSEFYNWSATYDRRSDIHFPYLNFTRSVQQKNLVIHLRDKLPQMSHQRRPNEAMVAWVVSHCHTSSRREEYVHLLQQHIGVDVFGWCGKTCESDCHGQLFKSGRYKFYLAFENSACKDYITEKALNPLSQGWVPIVYGGLSRKDYSETFPPHSYIDVRDYKSPKHLAKYLDYLDKNDTAYMEYFNWRQTYEVRRPNIMDKMCEICQNLYTVSNSTVNRIDFGEFWDPKTQCDIQSIEKVTGFTRAPSYLIGL